MTHLFASVHWTNAVTFETVVVAVGKEFSVRVKSTPTTGYIWEVHTFPEGVQLLGSDYEKPTSGIQPGDQAIQVFRFIAQRAGEHMITLVLKRQWERNAIETYTVTVKAN